LVIAGALPSSSPPHDLTSTTMITNTPMSALSATRRLRW
jgi:hypothetical protein